MSKDVVKKYTVYVDGITCAVCKDSITNVLTNAYGETTRVGLETGDADPKPVKVWLTNDESDYTTTWQKIAEIISDAGFEPKPYNYCPTPTPVQPTTPVAPDAASEDSAETTSEEENSKPLSQEEDKTKIAPPPETKSIFKSHWFLGILGCVIGLGLMALSFLTGGLPLFITIPIAIVSTALTIFLGKDSYVDAFKKLFKGHTLTMDTLFSLSSISVIIVSIAAFFVPWLPMMFEAGLLIYGFRHIGLAIEETIKTKIRTASFRDRIPKEVICCSDSGDNLVHIDQIEPDDIIEVQCPGDMIPLDGICEEDCTLYETIKTGSPLPRFFKAGEPVLAGMRLSEQSEPLKIRVTRNSKDSYLAKLDDNIENLSREPAPLETQTMYWLNYFIPAVIGLAVLSGILIGIFFTPALAIQCALSVLVSACPCTLGLVIPLAVKTGINKAAEHGVQFQSAKALQEASTSDTVIFDLHGTLTTGIPRVTRFLALDESNCCRKKLLTIACSLEAQSAHPIGVAIHSFARRQAEAAMVDNPLQVHHGLIGTINEKLYTIGNKQLMQESEIDTSAIDKNLHLSAGDNIIYLARDCQLLGYFIVSDPLRQDAQSTVQALVSMGKTVHICTGADELTANRYAVSLGIESVKADCDARAKTAYIQALQEEGHVVAMVGDAANDAMALEASQFGIAVNAQDSDAVTQAHASAIIQPNTLLPVASTFSISKQAVSNIKQNLAISLGYNILSILVAGGLLISFGISFGPAIGVILMVVQACIVLLNVYRFKQETLPHLSSEQMSTVPAESPESAAELEAQPKAYPPEPEVEEEATHTATESAAATPISPTMSRGQCLATAVGSKQSALLANSIYKHAEPQQTADNLEDWDLSEPISATY